jgi:hypothetical protein
MVERKMEFKMVSRRTEIAYKAEEVDEVAQHAKVQDCTSTVNAAVVPLEFAFLSGETCRTCASETKSVGASNGIDDVADPKGGWPERTAMERSAMAAQQRA